MPDRETYPLTAIAAFFSFPLEVLARRDFGERYHTLLKTLWHLLWLSALAAASYFIAASYTSVSPWSARLFGIFAFLFLFASILHQVAVFTPHRHGEPRRSDYDGDSWNFWSKLPLPPSHFTARIKVKMWLEPLPFLIAGALFFLFISRVFGGYLLFCSIAMIYKYRTAYLIAMHTAPDLSSIERTFDPRPPD